MCCFAENVPSMGLVGKKGSSWDLYGLNCHCGK